jgi:hypothetical protein
MHINRIFTKIAQAFNQPYPCEFGTLERKGTTLRYYHIDGNGNTIRILATQTGVSATSALHIDTSIKSKGFYRRW